MPGKPSIARSACKHGIEYLDVYVVLDDPLQVLSMADVTERAAQTGAGLHLSGQPNVRVFVGYDLSGAPLVVFVDRFENLAFHSEPGYRRFAWLFDR